MLFRLEINNEDKNGSLNLLNLNYKNINYKTREISNK